MGQDNGASADADQAAGLRPQPATQSSQSSIPSAERWLPKERSPIWGYARAMGVSMQKLMPEDFVIGYGDGIRIEGTITTMQEAEAVRETIRHLGQKLSSNRKMLAGDIGAEIPEPGWKDALYKMFGDPAQAIETRRAETTRLGAQHESAVGNADAPEPPSHSTQGDSNVIPAKQGE